MLFAESLNEDGSILQGNRFTLFGAFIIYSRLLHFLFGAKGSLISAQKLPLAALLEAAILEIELVTGESVNLF
jgi:hypothetical protein